MNNLPELRINEFDRWVGKRQALKVLELGHGKSILDVGCGVGWFTPMFLEKFERVVGIDPEEKFIKMAKADNKKVDYRVGWGETFKLDEKFDTIALTQLLEHVDNPIVLLKNCKKHLAEGGVIIIQVPNSRSVTRRLGVLMGVIDSVDHISEKERNICGHQRVYNFEILEKDCEKAGLEVVEMGGTLFKPLPNDILLEICQEQGKEWREKFIDALVKFGEDRPEDCANLYVVATR